MLHKIYWNDIEKQTINFNVILKTQVNSLFWTGIGPGEVKKLLENININKATDIYEILSKLIKLNKYFITELLTKIFNEFFSTFFFK